ncbi:MAG: hypothetical protein AB7F66_13030 [Bacteriovoracia bacterium]
MKPIFALLAFAFVISVSVSASAEELLHAENFRACGGSGKVADRILDCRERNREEATQVYTNWGKRVKTEWFLVTKDAGKAQETWLDTTANLVWGPTLDEKYNYAGARKACRDRGMLLPTARDYLTADENGLRWLLEDLCNKHFWTATRSQGYEDAAYFYNGSRGYVDDGNQDVLRYVRCILRRN